jgi:hypothetical protein
MKKKPSSGTRLPVSNPGPHKAVRNRRNVPADDLFLYAQSFHKAAKTLAAAFQADANPSAEADASAVVFMYRHAIELHLKSMVLGEGGNFLPTKPDPISISKTHSLSWLAQFVSQIVTALKWENEFRCEGIETLPDFKAVVEAVNSVDPGSYSFRFPANTEGQGSGPGAGKLTMRDFARRMDALLGLLDSTDDALAAEWDLQSEAPTETHGNGGGFEPTIQ